MEVLGHHRPNYFEDSPHDFHRSHSGPYFSGLALLRSGEIDRGTFLMKTYLEV
jgi:hypothetical protein